MIEKIDEALKALHEFIGDPSFEEEIKQAKEEFFSRVGAPLPGEDIEELRLSSFIEWFIFDRRLDDQGRTPAEEYLRIHAEELDGDGIEVMTGFTKTVRSVFLVKKRGPDRVDLKDLYTGLKHKKVRRAPVTLGKGDMAELRLFKAGEDWYATDAICFHPWMARKQIRKTLKAARKKGEPAGPALEKLMAMNTRFHRYPKTAKGNAYAD